MGGKDSESERNGGRFVLALDVLSQVVHGLFRRHRGGGQRFPACLERFHFQLDDVWREEDDVWREENVEGPIKGHAEAPFPNGGEQTSRLPEVEFPGLS